MKFTLTIEMNDRVEFDWVTAQLRKPDLKELKERVEARVAASTPATTGNGAAPSGGDPDPSTIARDLAEASNKAAAKSDAAATAGTPQPAKAKAAPKAKAAAAGTLVAPAPDAELQKLKDVITNAARLAMRGEGDKSILNLLPAFREATGLDFVMNATADHIPALQQLAEAANLVTV